MSVFRRTTVSGQNWDQSTAWTLVSGTGTYPISSADQAIWDSTLTASTSINAVAVTIGQIAVQNPAANQTIAVGTGAITLSPSAFSNISIDMLSGTTTATNMTIAATLNLPSSQTWQVASGRTLTISGAITATTGTLTLAGNGTVSLASIARAGWTGNAVVVQSGTLLSAAVSINTALGGTGNTINVQSGGAFQLTGTTVPNQTTWTVSGSGNSLQYGAIYLNQSTAQTGWNTRFLTVAANDTVISVNAIRTINIAGTISGDVVYNVTATGGSGGPFTSAASTITVGGYIRVRSRNVTTQAELGQYFAVGGTGYDLWPLGAATNKVWVESSSGLYANGTAGSSATDLTRDYTFDGETTTGVPAAGKAYALLINSAGTSFFNCSSGSITMPLGGRYFKIGSQGNASNQRVSFAGATLTGDFNIINFGATVALQFLTASDISGWTGSLQSTIVTYQKAPVGAATWNNNATIDNTLGSLLTLAHSSYNVGSFTFTGSNSMSLGPSAVTASASPTFTITANTLTIPGNIAVASGAVTKAGVGTLVLGGAMTGNSGFAWSAGSLTLNNNGAAGPAGATFTVTSTATLDSTTGATLTQSGTNALNANFTWKGTANLTFGAGAVTATAGRIITFAGTGETNTLKFSGAITTSLATTTWNFGGSTAGAKQRVTLGGANASLAAGTTANQHQVTAGYFRIENNDGLGAASTTTTWWVGATNAGTQTTAAALELAGVTTPDTKNVNLYNTGPNNDGALIGVSGTSVFQGGISVPNEAGTRIGVKAGATLTLLGSGLYPNLNPTNANTPISFVAESGGTLYQNRILGANVGAVTIANGTGIVVLSRANLHTGGTVCSAGTTRVTNTTATSTGNVTVSAGATLESTVQSNFQATLSLGTTSSLTRAILKFAA